MSRPTNYLSRSSAFKQFYWARVEEMMPFMDADAAERTIKAAVGANLEAGTISRMQALRGEGRLIFDDMDEVAKAYALDNTRELLYDVSEKHQFADMLRHVSPFLEAHMEVAGRWAKILYRDPTKIRRAQVLIEGAEGSGFIFQDPTTGDQMIGVPGSEWLTEKAFGVPFKMGISAKGMNIFSQNPLIPGLGPIVQAPLKKLAPFLPTQTEDWVRGNLLGPDMEAEEGQGIVERNLPAWAKKWWTAAHADPDTDRQFGTLTFDVLRGMVDQGLVDEEDLADPLKAEEIMKSAARRARGLFFIRGAAQFFSPSAPSYELMSADGVMAGELVKEFVELQKDDYETAVETFMDKHGENAFLYMQPNSKSIAYSLPVNTEGTKWLRDNPEVETILPNTFGFFAPLGGEFDPKAFARQFREGQRLQLRTKEKVDMAQHRIAENIYQGMLEKMGGRATNEAQRVYLADAREALKKDYPGWRDEAGLANRAKPADAINELYRALDVPALASTDAGQGLKVYLEHRERMLGVAASRGRASFEDSKDTADLREWMNRVGQATIEDHPGFAPLFDQLLSREVEKE